jgi:mannose-6-phosphate isomerase-like protein (cupin superfamily)
MLETLTSRSGAASAPLTPGGLSALMAQHGSMTLRSYAPKSSDQQTPHDRDELYIVVSGTGMFVREAKRVAFGPHDVLFAAAGETHRFEDFSGDFATWVVFYSPVGGESP